MDQSYKQFVDKLNTYIKRFYLYQLVRGLILFVLVLLVYFSSLFLVEYFNYFAPNVKLVILLTTVFITVVIFIYLILIPFSKLLGFGKILNFYDVSSLLSIKYPEIKDRLVNIIELANDSNSNYSSDLVKASIDQKIDELKIFSISDAIAFKDLKVFFFLLMGCLAFISLWFITFPDVFRSSSVRLIRYQQEFKRPSPFEFLLKNTNLEVISGESVDLELVCTGLSLPSVMYVNIGGNNYLMNGTAQSFKYTLENINSSLLIYFTDKQYVSKEYNISVLNKPFISDFTVNIKFPSYTNLAEIELQNVGDLKIAAGSTVTWNFNTVDTDSLSIVLNDSTVLKGIKLDDTFQVKSSFSSNCEYNVFIKNFKLQNDNSLIYKIEVTPDLFPEIKVVQIRDTLDFKLFHFKGNIIDDYGFHQLAFNVNINGKDSVINIPSEPLVVNQDFYFSFDFEVLKHLGKSFKYYFSVTDNDFINHYKKAISETYNFAFPDYKEMVSKENADLGSIDQLMKKSTQLAEEIQKEFENFKLKQINSTLSDWDKFQTVKDIVNKKNELQNVLDQIAQQNKDANNFMNSFSEEKTEIVEKQKQIDALLKDVFNDELKKLFDEFNELSKQFDSKKFDQLTKDMNSGLDDLSKQLDKNMQLLKKLKVEQKVERVLDELKKIKQSENDVRDAFSKKDIKDIGDTEKKNSDQFNVVSDEFKDITQFNNSLDKPMNLFDLSNEFESIKSKYSEILSNIDKNNKRKTGDGVGQNIKNLEQLIFSISQMLNKGKAKENEANIEDLKQILANLISFSFDQEALLMALGSLDFNNPLVNEVKVKQKNMIGQVEFVKDSIYALSKRTPEISSIINKEMLALESNVAYSFNSLESGNIGGSKMYQQYGITSANNLALFLSEALENIKKQQEDANGQSGDCDKPGGKKSKPGLGKLKEGQNSIKDQLQQMIDQMKSGDMGKLSKSIGQTIAQQEVMQQLINEMLNGKSVGSGAKNQLRAIDQLLDQSRKDLISRNISNELINRQNLILSKLLEAEKSEIERDFEEKRESKTASEIKKVTPQGYFEYMNTIKKENELLKRNNFQLQNFYNKKYNTFLNKVKN